MAERPADDVPTGLRMQRSDRPELVRQAPCNAFYCGRNSTTPGDLPRNDPRSLEETSMGVPGELLHIAVPVSLTALIEPDGGGGSAPDIPRYLRTLHLRF